MAKKSTIKPGAGDAGVAASADAALDPPRPGSRRCVLKLSSRAVKLLNTAVLVDDSDPSAVVEALIVTHLASYHAGKSTAAAPVAD